MSLGLPSLINCLLKTRIWQEGFIDFGSLLVNPTLDGGFQLTIHNSGEVSSPSFSLEPLNKAKWITSIDTWLPAFHIFVGIYVGRYRHEVPGLMNNGTTIHDLAAKGDNLRFYDEKVRFLRQFPATSLDWGDFQMDLWLRSQGTPKKSPSL